MSERMIGRVVIALMAMGFVSVAVTLTLGWAMSPYGAGWSAGAISVLVSNWLFHETEDRT